MLKSATVVISSHINKLAPISKAAPWIHSALVLLAVLFALPLSACGGGGGGTSTPPPPPPPSNPVAQKLTIGTTTGYFLFVGDKVQLTATCSYSDGSTKDVTSSVSWTATPAGVATLSNSGLLTTSGAGTASVSASYDSISASAQFLVSSPVTSADGEFSWQSVNTQGMGYVTGLIIHPLSPYDIYVRTDVGGAYRFDRVAQRWVPLLDRYGRLESELFGVESVAVDPTDANTVYLAAAHGRRINGSDVFSPAEVLVSHDKGATWSDTGLAAQGLYIGANDSFRGSTGERLAVDPRKPSIVYLGTRKNGLWRGTTTVAPAMNWTQITAGLPTSYSTPGVSFVIFDPSGGTTATGETRSIYTGVYGSGIYASADAGATWTQISSKTNPLRASVASDGTLFVTFGGDEGGTTGSVGRYKSGKWTDVTPLGRNKSYAGVSTDPTNPSVVITAENGNMQIYRSIDQGDTWTPVTVGSFSYKPAYYPQGAPSWGNAALVIDPAKPNRVWQTNGYGVIETEDITAATTTWTWQMDNLEELVVQKVKAPPVVTVPGTTQPGADLLSVVADMVGFRHTSRDTVPLSTIDSFLYVAQGTGVAYCASQPANAVFVGWDEVDVTKPMSGVTSDNGLTWKHIQNTSPGTGGKIAVSADDPKNMVWAPHNATPQFTRDGGVTWQKAQLNGAPLPSSWQLQNEWWTADVLAADMVAPGTFYYFDSGNLYSSSDGGATWKLANSTWPQDPRWVLNPSIVPNPAKAGDIWMSFAPNSNQPWTYQLVHSTDGGKTFSAINTLQYANFVAFGKGTNSSTPFIYIHGRAIGDTQDAIYKSEDLGATWKRISDPSLVQFGIINSLEGDMRTADLVYVGLSGRGIVYGYGAGSGISRTLQKRNH